jgi:hypothetical protein
MFPEIIVHFTIESGGSEGGERGAVLHRSPGFSRTLLRGYLKMPEKFVDRPSRGGGNPVFDGFPGPPPSRGVTAYANFEIVSKLIEY